MTRRSPLPLPLGSGAFRVSDGVRLGVSRDRLRATDLARPFWGVRVVTSEALSALERCAAILQRMPPGSFFSHHTAARIIGIPLPLPLEECDEVHIGVVASPAPCGRAASSVTPCSSNHPTCSAGTACRSPARRAPGATWRRY